jgi:cardiolipin synthase
MTLLMTSGCASLPEIGHRLKVNRPERALEVKGPRGYFAPQAGETIIELAAEDESVSENLKLHLRIEQDLLGSPLTHGNHVKLLVDAPAAFEAMFQAMEEAEDHIHLETYLLSDDAVGQQVADLLLRKRFAGLEVRIIYDGIGSRNSSPEYFERLRRGGVEIIEFHPFDFPRGLNLLRLNLRDHRKLLIVDGRIAFTGGINIADVYSDKIRGTNGDRLRTRDTQLRIEGPAAAEFQKIFLNVWNEKATEEALALLGYERGRYFPPLDEKGQELVRAVPMTAGGNGHEMYKAYMAALRSARRRIWITQAYFVPTKEVMIALQEAAARGVDVRIILPGVSDHPIVQACSRSKYETLLDSGIRLYERSEAMLHAKTAVIDGVWSTVGSTNLDYRSFLYNNETNAIIIGRRFGAAMEELFLEDLSKSIRVLPEEWRKRPLKSRVMETIVSLVERWM